MRFQCGKCEQSYDSFREAKQHAHVEHPREETEFFADTDHNDDERGDAGSPHSSHDGQSSPSHRVRKVSIQFSQHPNLQVADTTGNVQDVSSQGDPAVNHADNSAVTVDTRVPASSNGPEQTETHEETDDVTDNEHAPANDSDTDSITHEYDQSRSQSKEDHDLLSNCAEPPPPIDYDETKPKRLKPPTNVHSEVAANQTEESTCRSNINKLLAPDEPDNANRNQRRSGENTCRTDIATELDKIFSHDKDRSSPLRYANSQSPQPSPGSSPTLIRRYNQHDDLLRHCIDVQTINGKRCSSPVQRRRNRTSSPSTAHISRRKISSDARLGPTPEHLKDVAPPQRKISSDARLGAYYSNAVPDTPHLQQLDNAAESKKRRVSFGATYINGHGTMALNDESAFLPVSETQDEAALIVNSDVNKDDIINNGHAFDNTEGHSSKQLVSNGDTCISNAGVDNIGYIHDDTPHNWEQTYSYQKTDVDPPTQHNSPATLTPSRQYTVSPARVHPPQRLSTSSIPSKRMSWQSDDSTVSIPKSILKVRREDCESLASEDSLASTARQFNVRKDSLALFHDQNGVIEIHDTEKRRSWSFQRFDRNEIKRLWAARRQLISKFRLHLCVLTLFILTAVFVIIGLYFHDVHYETLAVSQKVYFDVKTRKLTLPDIDEMDYMYGDLGQNIPSWLSPRHCYSNFESIHDKTCLIWKGHARLNIVHFEEDDIQCYNVSWHMEPNVLPLDCFELGDSYWYGPVNSSESQWPIRNGMFSFSTERSNHHDSGTFTSAVEYYWVSSRGVGVVVDSNFPLHMSWNQLRHGHVCFTGTANGDFYTSHSEYLNLKYTVCNGGNVRSTHTFIRQYFFPNITSLPDTSLLSYPHWSAVWESDDDRVNETTVVNLALAIEKHKLNCSTIELDGKWESKFGDLIFNERAFKNMSKMFDSLAAASCDVALNVFPYFSFHSTSFQEGISRHYFIKDESNQVPALVKWQHGVGAMLDVTNPAARNWIITKMRKLVSKYNIRTFRFAYGTSSWLPHKPVFYMERINPNKVKQLFTDLFASFGETFIQSTAQSQHIPGVIGIASRVIKQDETDCLRNIIPDVLNLGMMGYPFINSDGFTQKVTREGQQLLPSRELFVRWMQVSAFMSSMRYTVKPWSYDEEVIAASRNMSQLHIKVVNEITKMKADILTGMPIIRPMWWIDPRDIATFTIDDQFLIGDKLLVAPILCESSSGEEFAMRDIYIPKGIWKNPVSNSVIVGRKWVRQYKVGQFEIPYFERLPEYLPI